MQTDLEVEILVMTDGLRIYIRVQATSLKLEGLISKSKLGICKIDESQF